MKASYAFVLFGVTFPFSSEACVGTDLSVQFSAMAMSKSCAEYVLDGKRPNTKSWVSDRDRFVTNKGMIFFNDYQNFDLQKRTHHCEYDTYLAIGFSEIDDKRICHIAYEQDFKLGLSVIPIEFLRKKDFDLSLLSISEEDVEGERGVTEIVSQSFCIQKTNSGVMTVVSVGSPTQSRVENKSHDDGIDKHTFPIQHIYFTNDTCIQPTE